MMYPRFPNRTAGVGLVSLAAALACGAPAHAQVVERYGPDVPQGEPAPLLPPEELLAETDETPLGVNLSGVTLLDGDEAVKPAAAPGIDLGRVLRLAPMSERVREDLAAYVGRPLSRKLIAEIRAAIVVRYRDLGFPFVAVITPEQDISSGVLQLQVVEFRIGQIDAQGVADDAKAAMIAQIGLDPGDPIDARALSDDLYWINLYPFAQTRAVFSPAEVSGATNLSLARTAARPWGVYAGYQNSGAPSSGRDRFFVGGLAGGLLGRNSLIAYQGTGSRNAFEGVGDPAYVGHALNYFLPAGHNGRIELNLSQVETNTINPFFTNQFRATQGDLGYRFSVTPWFNSGIAQMAVGVSAKHQSSLLRFDDETVFDAVNEDYQLFAELSRSNIAVRSSSNWAVRLTLAPGNLGDGNSKEQAIQFSQGRLNDARYAYLGLIYNRSTDLGQRLVWRTEFNGQLTDDALPRTEQAGLGGAGLVRGYSLDDGAFDRAAVLRNEFGMQAPIAIGAVNLQPYVFADIGHGRDLFTSKDRDLFSAGVGMDFALTSAMGLQVDIANALRRGSDTAKGATRIEASLRLRY